MSKQTALQRINKLILDNFEGYKELLDYTVMYPLDEHTKSMKHQIHDVEVRDCAYLMCRKIVEEEIK